jgi:thioredoxin-like negative regulator of GroEL
MGFIKRLLGLEVRPGEPEKLTDMSFEGIVKESGLPCFVYFYHLWCSSCQVMGGLLNELGPEYKESARFYKIDITKDPHTAGKYRVNAVPAVLFFRDGRLTDALKGLTPLNELRDWIEGNL